MIEKPQNVGVYAGAVLSGHADLMTGPSAMGAAFQIFEQDPDCVLRLTRLDHYNPEADTVQATALRYIRRPARYLRRRRDTCRNRRKLSATCICANFLRRLGIIAELSKNLI